MPATGERPEIPAECPLCQQEVLVETSPLAGDAICPQCGTLFWPDNTPEINKRRAERPPGHHKSKVEQSLGRSTLGHRFLLRHMDSQRWMVLHVLDPSICEMTELVEEALIQCERLKKLRPPHLLRILGQKFVEDRPSVVTEHIACLNLGTVLKDLGRISVPDAASLLIQCAKALHYLETCSIFTNPGILTPTNIYFSDDGKIKLTEFLGLSFDPEPPVQVLTPENKLLPTRNPLGKIVPATTHMYELGLLFDRCVTGGVPFQPSNPLDDLNARLNGKVGLVLGNADHLPASISELIRRMTATNVQDRFQSFRELINHLEALNIASSRMAFFK